MDMLKFISEFLIAKFPFLAAFGANALAIMLAINVLIEALEVVAKLTATAKDDELLGKTKAIVAKAIPILEILPHVNVPLAPAVMLVVKIMGKIAAALKALVK